MLFKKNEVKPSSKYSLRNIVIIANVAIIVIYLLSTNSRFSKNYHQFTHAHRVPHDPVMCETNRKKYKQDCMKLFKELKDPNPSQFYRPPLARPPADLFDEFTQYGDMPITKYLYINEVYSDADKDKTEKMEIVTKDIVDSYRLRNGQRVENYYQDISNNDLMTKYSKSNIHGKTLTVIGTQKPWLEAIALDAGASKVITLEYTRKEYEQKNILEWLHIHDYLDYLIKNDKIEQFDNAATYSSLEHTGLGRYGDPLDPNGDIKAAKQVHCMIKPDGLFFLGLPTSNDDSSYIEFNAHRIYGYKRLEKLFEGWDYLEEQGGRPGHTVYVLRKRPADGC